ncbi:MAG: MATE family efflux transporter [Fusobacterium sp.]|uniref:MATE family efflux transporter n=1 Tax=Fusobacterium sp. TaxID=68766 RepID=UPI0026DCDE0C|nr:MATE family efflux transporter [Fusobacterium sp.]MDO4690837.1 MATE family efflux transporter [Fusobacterium sp.]
MENKHNFMETENITRLLIKFSFPAMIGMFVNALYNVVDRIYIGNIKEIGHLGITGVGISFPIVILIFSFALLIGIGGAASISLRLGAKQRDEAERILAVGVFFSTSVSIALLLLINIFMDEIIMLIGGSEKTFFYAKSYLFYLNFGAPAVIVGNTLNAAIRADGNPKMGMITLLIGAITNIILDPIFIFYFKMGVKGAAIATIISQYISAAWTVFYFNSSLSRLKLHLKYIQYDYRKIKKICTLGSSAFAIQIGFSIVTYFLNKTLRRYGGDISIGAMAIIQSIITFMTMPIFGINQGILPILGYNYGAKKYPRVKEIMFKAMMLATVICVVGFLISQLFASNLIRIFTDNKELEKLTVRGLRIYTLAFPIIGFQIISSIYFQAIGKPIMSFLISSSRQILFMIPLLIILGKIFGLGGIWYSAAVADTLSSLISFILIKKELKNLKILDKLENSYSGIS